LGNFALNKGIFYFISIVSVNNILFMGLVRVEYV